MRIPLMLVTLNAVVVLIYIYIYMLITVRLFVAASRVLSASGTLVL